jgi:hypothetical protein
VRWKKRLPTKCISHLPSFAYFYFGKANALYTNVVGNLYQSMIIGDKFEFAVEYSFTNDYPKDMGYGRIWVKNKFIGTYEDLIFLGGYLLGTLYEFRRAKDLNDELKHLTKEKLFDLFYNDEEGLYRKYHVGGSTFTDDFSIWTYKLEDTTCLLWKIVLRNDPFEDLKDYSKDVFLGTILTYKMNSIIDELETEFKDKGIVKVQ